MKHEITKESCNCTGGCKCPITGLPIHKVVTGLIVLVLLGLTTWNTVKINKIYSGTISQYGNEANFKTRLEISQSSGFVSRNAESLESLKTQLGLGAANQEAKAEEKAEESTTTQVVNTDLAIGDAKWAANAQEANVYFGLQGTPGNAIVNVKNGNFKAIGGALPQSAFEAAVAAVKAGNAVADDFGKAGTLTPEQVAALLQNVHYYGDKNAEVVIVEYSDLLCPYCQRQHSERVLENIVDADKTVAKVFKNNPIAGLHPTAPLGAKGAECAGQIAGSEAFYNYLDKAFTYSTFNKDNVVEIATSLGLDKAKFEACVNG